MSFDRLQDILDESVTQIDGDAPTYRQLIHLRNLLDQQIATERAALPGPRAYTREEVRDQFLRHISVMVDYWNSEVRARSTLSKMTGLVHSILAMLDGSSMNLPGFMVIPAPHPADQEYHRENNENWYPTEALEYAGVLCDISGGLHEVWHQYRPNDPQE